MPTFRAGDVFRGLALDRFLAAGAHGEVYAAHSIATGAPFALKVVQLADRQSRTNVERALAAARGAFAVEHPNVVTVHDVGLDADGSVCLVMELLRGCSVDALLRWGRVSTVFGLSIAIEATKGLGAVHAAGIIHRDVKPANLFLVNVGPGRTAIKVLDFTTAKVFGGGVSTTSGRAGLGTPGYLCPEHVAGATPHPGMDVYGLGMTLWEILAGYHPYEAARGEPAELLRLQRDVVPPLLSQVAGLPPSVDSVVQRAVAKRAAMRYADTAEMLGALVKLRAWLVEQERAGRVKRWVPAGQPPIPGDVDPYGAPSGPVQDPAATLDMETDMMALIAQRKDGR